MGRWLPEPLLAGDRMLGPADTAEQRDSVSYAVLTLMERLSPNERAVYALREAFDYPHRDIAEVLDISEASSQQIFHRAQKHVAHPKARPDIDKAAAQRIAEEFFAAATSGRTDELVPCSPRTISIGDGGGKVPARTKAFEGAVAVATFVWGMFRPAGAKRAIVGGSPQIYGWTANGEPAVVAVVDGRVVAIMRRRSPPRASLPAVLGQPRQARAGDRPMGGGRPRGAPVRDVTGIASGCCPGTGGARFRWHNRTEQRTVDMRITIFGANGPTGRLLTAQALEAGHRVRAVTRQPNGFPLHDARLDVAAADVSTRRPSTRQWPTRRRCSTLGVPATRNRSTLTRAVLRTSSPR